MGRTKKRAKEREKQRRQRRRRNIAIVVGVIAILAVIGVILATRPVEVAIQEEVLERYDGLPVTYTDRGFPTLGNPEAPARLVEYSSFDCPACADFHDNITKNIIDRVREGEASFTYVPVFGTGGIPNGERAARAALCAGEQGRFYEYHDLLFEWQQTYIASAFQPARLTAGAEALGLDVEQFNTCLSASDTVDETLDNARAAFGQSGGTGTPSLQINNELVNPPTLNAVNSRIDLIMESAEPVPLTTDEETEAAEEATEEVEVTEEATEEPEATEESEVTEEPEATEESEAIEEPEATEEATEESE